MEAQRAARPRLWCPGLACVTPAGAVQLGRTVGYSSHDRSFRRLCCGRRSRLEYWTHVAWLVPRMALDAGLVAEHAIILPESLVDKEAQPHAYRWLHEQPLVCLSGVTWRRLAEARVRAFRVSFDATRERELEVEDTGGPGGPSLLTVSLQALESAASVVNQGLPLLDVHGDPSPIDRALRLLSGGVLDELSVLNAFDARRLIEDGYGYRGAVEGSFTEITTVTRELRVLDALFGQIFRRAAPMRKVAGGLLAALSHAPRNASEVAVPLYGTASRVVVPALHVPGVERLVLGGASCPDLELSSERRWSVTRVDSWSPRVPPHLVPSARPPSPP